jgi:hypothetical protein
VFVMMVFIKPFNQVITYFINLFLELQLGCSPQMQRKSSICKCLQMSAISPHIARPQIITMQEVTANIHISVSSKSTFC